MSKTSYAVVMKAVTWFILLGQIRRQATDEEDRQLTDNIRTYGVLQALGARPDGKLVWGHRRLRCSIAAGLTEVPCVILDKDMTEGQYLTPQMLENVQRSDLSAYDLWQGCLRLQEANKWQYKEIAQALSMDPASVTRLMAVSKCIPEWQEALKVGKVGVGDCYAASKLDADGQRGLLNLKLQGATRDALEQAGRKAREASQPAQPPERTAKIKIPLAVKVETVAVKGTVTVAGAPGEEVDLADAEQILVQALRAVKDAQKKGLGLKAAQASWKDMAAKGV